MHEHEIIKRNQERYGKTAGRSQAEWERLRQRLDQSYGPSQSQVMHTWPDGWSIQRHDRDEDIKRIGEMMANCWKKGRSNYWQYNRDTDQYESGGPIPYYYSLHDPLGRPKLALDAYENQAGLPLMAWNGSPQDSTIGRSYLKRLAEWASTMGYDRWTGLYRGGGQWQDTTGFPKTSNSDAELRDPTCPKCGGTDTEPDFSPSGRMMLWCNTCEDLVKKKHSIHPEADDAISRGLGRIAYRTTMSSVMYHNSPVANRQSILAHGLLAGMDESSLAPSDGGAIYLSGQPIISGTEDTWAVNVEGLKVEQDMPEMMHEWRNEGGAYFIMGDIEPARVTLYHEAGPPKASKQSAAPVMYHVAPRSARASIQAHGIDYTKGQSGTDYEQVGNQPGNYLWADPQQAQYTAQNKDEPWDVWQVNADGLALAPDPYWQGTPTVAHYTPEPIGPERVSLYQEAGHPKVDTRNASTMHPTDPLIAQGQVFPYSALPPNAQAAIEQYLGKEWGRDYRNLPFGYAEVPMRDLTHAIRGDDQAWQASHQRYLDSCDEDEMPDHDVSKPLWPVMLSTHPGRIIEDGWHRLHDYYRKGVQTVPLVWQAQDQPDTQGSATPYTQARMRNSTQVDTNDNTILKGLSATAAIALAQHGLTSAFDTKFIQWTPCPRCGAQAEVSEIDNGYRKIRCPECEYWKVLPGRFMTNNPEADSAIIKGLTSSASHILYHGTDHDPHVIEQQGLRANHPAPDYPEQSVPGVYLTHSPQAAQEWGQHVLAVDTAGLDLHDDPNSDGVYHPHDIGPERVQWMQDTRTSARQTDTPCPSCGTPLEYDGPPESQMIAFTCPRCSWYRTERDGPLTGNLDTDTHILKGLRLSANTPTLLYHTSPGRNHESIMAAGLVPNAPSDGNTTPAVYLWDNPADAHEWQSTDPDARLYEVRAHHLNLQRDPWHDGAWMTSSAIEPQHIRPIVYDPETDDYDYEDPNRRQSSVQHTAQPTQVYYHRAPSVYRQSIAKHGLWASDPGPGQPSGVYADPRPYDFEAHSQYFPDYDVWAIEPQHYEWQTDPSQEWARYSPQSIRPEHMSLVWPRQHTGQHSAQSTQHPGQHPGQTTGQVRLPPPHSPVSHAHNAQHTRSHMSSDVQHTSAQMSTNILCPKCRDNNITYVTPPEAPMAAAFWCNKCNWTNVSPTDTLGHRWMGDKDIDIPMMRGLNHTAASVPCPRCHNPLSVDEAEFEDQHKLFCHVCGYGKTVHLNDYALTGKDDIDIPIMRGLSTTARLALTLAMQSDTHSAQERAALARRTVKDGVAQGGGSFKSMELMWENMGTPAPATQTSSLWDSWDPYESGTPKLGSRDEVPEDSPYEPMREFEPGERVRVHPDSAHPWAGQIAEVWGPGGAAGRLYPPEAQGRVVYPIRLGEPDTFDENADQKYGWALPEWLRHEPLAERLQHPDPWMDNEPGSVTFPESWKWSSEDSPRTLYHTSPMSNREDIRNLGLRAKHPYLDESITDEVGNDPGIYGLADPAGFGPEGVWPHNPRYHDIWAFDTHGLYVDPDPASGMQGSWLADADEIPADRLRLHYEAPGDSKLMAKTAAETLPQEIRRWQELYPSQQETIAQLPNGYTIRRNRNDEAVRRVGEMMRNCWQGVEPEDLISGPYQEGPEIYANEEEGENPWLNALPNPRFMSLHDEHGIPRVAYYESQDGTEMHEPLGMRNNPPEPHYAEALAAHAAQQGMMMKERKGWLQPPDAWLDDNRKSHEELQRLREEVRRPREGGIGHTRRMAMPMVPVNYDALKLPRDQYVGESPVFPDREAVAYNSPEYTAWLDKARPQFEAQRQRQHEWDYAAQHAMATGRMTPEQVTDLGYRPMGHESDGDWAAPKWGKWQPLPQKLYHVTTNLPAVLADGRLKSPYELDLEAGRGLGGSASDKTISLTDSLDEALNIKRAMLEGADVASGRLPIQRLYEMAMTGEGAQRPWLQAMFGTHDWSQGMPMDLHDLLHNQRRYWSHDYPEGHPLRNLGWNTPMSEEEWAQHGFYPDQYSHTWMGGDGKQRVVRPARKMTPEEEVTSRFDWWRNPWAPMRGYHGGGPDDPLFTGVDPHWFANLDPAHVGILEAQPVPNGHGYPMSALGEWRIPTGEAVNVTGVHGQRTSAVDGDGFIVDEDSGERYKFIAWPCRHCENRGMIYFPDNPTSHQLLCDRCSSYQGSDTPLTHNPEIDQAIMKGMRHASDDFDPQKWVSQAPCYSVAHDLSHEHPELEYQAGYYVHPSGYEEPHAWVRDQRGRIIDPTHRQFEDDRPLVIASPDDDYYSRYRSWEDYPDQPMGDWATKVDDDDPLLWLLRGRRGARPGPRWGYNPYTGYDFAHPSRPYWT